MEDRHGFQGILGHIERKDTHDVSVVDRVPNHNIDALLGRCGAKALRVPAIEEGTR